MINKKNKWSFFLLAVIFIFFNITTVAKAYTTNVDDKASLLNKFEIEFLQEYIEEVKELTNLDVVIVTTDDVKGKSSMEYADDYYDDNDYGLDNKKSGILLLINMEDREVWISTTGLAINYFTDSRIEKMLDNITYYLADDEYYDGCMSFLEDVEEYQSPKEIKSARVKMTAIIAAISSIILGAVSCICVTFSYKKPPRQSGANYLDTNSIKYTRKDDIFITTHTIKTKIQTNNSGSHHSSTHKSSSGRSHGGGGRKF